MVKIFENAQSIEKGNRRNKLVRLARTGFLEGVVHDEISHDYFSVSVQKGIEKSVFFVFPEQNVLKVYSALGLFRAVELGKRYEESGESEFRIQKCYD